MKKILSIFMAMAMLFAFAAVPSFAEGEETAVDFTAAANIAYQKAATTIVAEGDPATLTAVTDGDIATAYTSEGAVAFTLDLATYYEVNNVTLYLGTAGAELNLYSGAAVNADTLIGKVTAATDAVTIGETQVYPATINIDGARNAAREYSYQTLTFEYAGADALAINEIYADVRCLDGGWNIAKDVAIVYPTYSNYSEGRACSDSSSFNLNRASPSKPITGLTDGGWASGYLYASTSGNTGTNKNAVFTIDLGDFYSVEEISFYQASGRSKGVTVYLGQTGPINGWATIKADTRKLIKDGGSTAVTTKVLRTDGTSMDLGLTKVTIPEGEVARYITVSYSCQYTNMLYDVTVKGEKVEGTVIDFRSADNIAIGKTEDLVYRTTNLATTFYSSNGPKAGVHKTTDGNIKSAYSGHKPYVMKIDLGDIYDITKVDLYCTADTVGSTNYNIYLDTTGTYNLGSISPDRKKTDRTIGDEIYTINGVDRVRKGTMEFDSVPARYLYFEYNGSSSFYTSQIVVNGTKTVKFGEAGNYYSYADGNVTAILRLYNGTEAASTAGKVYFAAYNANDALVGYTVADAAALEAGASVEITPEAFSVTEEPAYVKAFYWVDGTFVPVLLPTAVK
ncbi:MAG: hypothetical protein E7406_02865 [Ruminococcaceae bacterium]|nr:hypothetical protein [Oscillospiraceae bacterium]